MTWPVTARAGEGLAFQDAGDRGERSRRRVVLEDADNGVRRVRQCGVPAPWLLNVAVSDSSSRSAFSVSEVEVTGPSEKRGGHEARVRALAADGGNLMGRLGVHHAPQLSRAQRRLLA